MVIFVSYISIEIIDSGQKRDISLIKDVSKSVQQELYLASEVETGYERVFNVPLDLEGSTYSIENSEKKLILRIENYDLALTIPEVTGSIMKGSNMIRKTGGRICIGNITCDDVVPPIIISSGPSGIVASAQVTLEAETNEDSTCKYSLSDEGYFSMRDFFDGSNTEHDVSLTLTEGSHTYYVRCKDMTGNIMTSSEQIAFSIMLPDTVAPSIWLVLPEENALVDPGNITFTYNVSDEKSSVSSCELIINGTINKTVSSPIENENLNITTELTNSSYAWWINCTDSSGNKGESETRDLAVGS
ncbi:hypothetical protein JXA85_04045 [Candidatus Woesearchaeota archaeon]|nr:hypothetical protein [Candidatus Woesearchaeota archaeon]